MAHKPFIFIIRYLTHSLWNNQFASCTLPYCSSVRPSKPSVCWNREEGFIAIKNVFSLYTIPIPSHHIDFLITPLSVVLDSPSSILLLRGDGTQSHLLLLAVSSASRSTNRPTSRAPSPAATASGVRSSSSGISLPAPCLRKALRNHDPAQNRAEQVKEASNEAKSYSRIPTSTTAPVSSPVPTDNPAAGAGPATLLFPKHQHFSPLIPVLLFTEKENLP